MHKDDSLGAQPPMLGGKRRVDGRTSIASVLPTVPMKASAEERAYFQRLGAANRRLNPGSPPTSLAEAFERMAKIQEIHGQQLRPAAHESDGDLQSHLAFLAACRRMRHRLPDASRMADAPSSPRQTRMGEKPK